LAYLAAGGVAPSHVTYDQEDSAALATMTTANADAIFAATPELRHYLGTWNDFASFQQARSPWAELYWDDAVRRLQSRAMRECYTDVLRSFWPHVTVSFYSQELITMEESWNVNASTGLPSYWTGIAGTHAAPEMYGYIGANYGADQMYYWGTGAFAIFKWEIARLRAQRRSFPNDRFMPYVAGPNFSPDDGHGGTGPLYTREKIFHAALCGVDGIQYFNGSCDAGENAYMNEAAGVLQTQLGNFDRTNAIIAPIAKTDTYVLSGMKLEGKGWLWRCSFGPDVTTVSMDGQNIYIAPNERGVWYSRANDPNSATPPVVVTSP
jgi:hypothetical protein